MPVRYSAEEHLADLRGESRPFNGQWLGLLIGGLCVVALLALSATFFATAAHHNATVSDLEHHGVRVSVRVTACTGLLGGSGSNGAGYACRGTFTLDGMRYSGPLPDTAPHRIGSTVVDITPSDAPGHLTTVAVWRTARPSARLYVVPIILGVAGLAGAVLVVRSLRLRRRAATDPAPGL